MKDKAVEKWKPVFESIGVTDPYKIKILANYAENKSIHHANGIFQDHEILPYEIRVLAKVNMENKVVIINGFNDFNFHFTNVHPVEKFTISIEKIQENLKLVRIDKLKSIEGDVPLSDVSDRAFNIFENVIATDINERLKYKNILYIDVDLISEYTEILNTYYKSTFEFTTKYDVL